MRKVACLWAALIATLASQLCQADTNTNGAAGAQSNPLRDVYYGDLHLHTSYSFDAYLLGRTNVDPDAAYRFAKGQVVDYLGQPVQRREPLDFLAVTDHSENLGVFRELEDPRSPFSQSEPGKMLQALLAFMTAPDGRRDLARLDKAPPDFGQRFAAFVRQYIRARKDLLPALYTPASTAAWAREIEFANRNYEPGKFTTFIAYEWTADPNGANLHRNVIFKGDAAPSPFTALDSRVPEDLWHWLETVRKQGFEALAIPHNANASNGLMYDWIDSGSMPIDRAYAEERQANEPLSEISQSKGASETHPLLSPNDELADYEIYDYMAGLRHHAGRPQGSYLRDALSKGLVLQRQVEANPYKYGFVGASDLHSGLSVSAQADYGGSNMAINAGGGKPNRAQVARLFQSGGEGVGTSVTRTSGNLTGVWAESNTRESIFAALRRRETFATSGTKLKFRFFGGWGFGKDLVQESDWVATAYAQGVPMGGDLPKAPARATPPTFAIWAVKDPNGANLDRVQVVKVWEEGGRQREQVFDAVWSGNRRPDPKTGKLPAVGNTVDLKTGRYTNTIGATELTTVWTDPQFDPRRLAAYYLRVLEIPTPRWSTLLAIENGLPLPKDVPATEQQRGWSSPIWIATSTN